MAEDYTPPMFPSDEERLLCRPPCQGNRYMTHRDLGWYHDRKCPAYQHVRSQYERGEYPKYTVIKDAYQRDRLDDENKA